LVVQFLSAGIVEIVATGGHTELQGLPVVTEAALLMLVDFGVFAAAGLRRRGAKVA
jgi:hypothetical protein